MDWVKTGVFWVGQGIDWVADGLVEVLDPRWLRSNTGWAALLGLGVLLAVGWLCLFQGRKGR